MFLFNKGKKNNESPAQNAVPSKPVSSGLKPIVNADDFFKDMGRKPKVKKAEFDIDVPEVTGLREAPPPAPESTINVIGTDSGAADMLEDKSVYAHPEELGNINTIDVSVLDTENVLPDKTLQPSRFVPFEIPEEEEKAADPLDPDSFFRAMDKRRARKRIKTSVEAPEITGLRDAPAEAPHIDISNIDTSSVSTDALIDKSAAPEGEIYGNISALSSENIDTGSLREAAEV